MPRRLSVLGSSLLVCGVAAFVAAVGDDLPAAPNGGPNDARVAARPNVDLLRVASAEATPLRLPANADPSTRALHRTVELLRDGLEDLADVPAYTATFEKREAVDGVLLDPQVMDMTLRHEPFGVHLAWVEGQRGRTLLYETGRNDGEMLVNLGGWRGRLTGTLSLDINGAIARREARHPVTNVGLKQLASTVLRYRLAALESAEQVECQLVEGHDYDGRPAWKHTLTYRSPEVAGEYRRCVTYIDREWNLPVLVETYGWPMENLPEDELDARTLLERYSYTNVDLACFKNPADLTDLAEATGFCVK